MNSPSELDQLRADYEQALENLRAEASKLDFSPEGNATYERLLQLATAAKMRVLEAELWLPLDLYLGVL